MNGDEIKYYAKFGISASGILEATSKKREISAFTVQKKYLSATPLMKLHVIFHFCVNVVHLPEKTPRKQDIRTFGPNLFENHLCLCDLTIFSFRKKSRTTIP